METIKKTVSELIALYTLENKIYDIYVEGNCDKVFYDNYLQSINSNIVLKLIDTIDFQSYRDAAKLNLDMKSNRNKAICLSNILAEQVGNAKAKCIIDKDFDDYLASVENTFLLKTDFTCLESYLFCKNLLKKFLNMAVRAFPIKVETILLEIGALLKILYAYRLLRVKEYQSAKLVDIISNIQIDKQTGLISFDEYLYFEKFIQKNNLNNRKIEIWEIYQGTLNTLNKDVRNSMNGHDFIDVLFHYISTIKNTLGFKKEVFERTIFLAIENSMVHDYELFVTLRQLSLNI